MIEVIRLFKSYRTRQGRRYVFRDLNLTFPDSRNVALLGKNGAGKSTLMRILGGIDFPDKGEVRTDKRLSWPLALAGGFQGSLSGKDNVKFVCRVYGTEGDLADTLAFVHEFSELGEYFFEPLKSYSSGMRSRLAFALSLAFEFDVYLVDEVTAVGDEKFRRKAKRAFEDLKGKATLIMVSHDMQTLKAHCDAAVYLEDGKATYYDDLAPAIARYQGMGQ